MMKRGHFEVRNRLCLFVMAFENLNMYAKGTYLIKVESTLRDQQCSVSKSTIQGQDLGLLEKEPLEQFSKSFMIRFQNQKVDLSELFVVQTPMYKFSSEASIHVLLTLIKVESGNKSQEKTSYSRLATCSLLIRFTLNSVLEYCECTFQEPFLSSLSLLVFSQPVKVVIETRSYKHASGEQFTQLKKEVKRLRYNNYLMQNKFKKVIYNEVQYRFTLPKMFVSGENEMTEVESTQEKFLNYLIMYEKLTFTPEIMNYELTSICQKNDSLQDVFKESCANGTIFVSKLRMENEEKEAKRFRQYITREDHKHKFCAEYKAIVKEKLKLLEKESKVVNNEQVLNNIITRSERDDGEEVPYALPVYPIVIHEIERIKQGVIAQEDDKQHKQHVRYIFLLAHGYQGCSQDLIYIANGLKRKYKKSKYLILKSYQSLMDQSLLEMAKVATEEVNAYLSGFNFEQKQYRIVMIGHSMGGLILRCVAANIAFPQNLYCFISMGSPHLGYLQGIKFFIKAGISFLSNISSNVCLGELSSKDNSDLHECLIYRLSLTAPLSAFKKLVFLSSVHDKYVPWHSARLQHYKKDPLKQFNFIEHEMIDNIIGKQNRIQRIDRIEVNFKSLENNMDKIIGRSSHIKFLNDHQFIELFINGCLKDLLDE